MLDRASIDHASPTLARLKLGSLINLEIGEGFFGEFARLSDTQLSSAKTAASSPAASASASPSPGRF